MKEKNMAVGRNAQIALLIGASNLTGTGAILKRLDKNNTGTDDLAGTLLSVFSPILVAVADDDISDLRSALRLNIETSQKLLDELGEES